MQDDIRLYEAEGFKALKEPGVGRSLPVFGFVLAEPFDALLRMLTTEYLQAGWNNLRAVLTHHNLMPDDFSYGLIQEACVPDFDDSTLAPSDFTGWTSFELNGLEDDKNRCRLLNDELLQGTTPLRCAYTWRSIKWKIKPNNFPFALRLLQCIWTDEISEWSPQNILRWEANRNSLWGQIAVAIEQRDQILLDSLMADARAQYSPAGYKIVLRGFASYITGAGGYLPADIGDHLSLQMRDSSGHSHIYPEAEEN